MKTTSKSYIGGTATSSSSQGGHNQEMSEEIITRESILQKMKQKDLIEENIDALGGILTSNHISMTEPLVDGEGFPRNDIDVYQVRHARHQIICLQNDRKAIIKEIEEMLKIFHERSRDSGESSMEVDSSSVDGSKSMSPIAKVNQVADNSPAFSSGLKVDDEIIAFGSIRGDNFTSITDIGNLVKSSTGRTIYVKVKRGSAILKLALIPGPWSGKGMLGCNILPIETTNIDR